ncbi:MAG: MotA/TolQ/ExbB proton channel family protein [Planctomycetes bacterium]|nr:MotA/TolQ/ExbB proton channel family protein [Planctomycetota bacterium]
MNTIRISGLLRFAAALLGLAAASAAQIETKHPEPPKVEQANVGQGKVAQGRVAQGRVSFDQAVAKLRKDLDASLAELTALRKKFDEERRPKGERISELEGKLFRARAEAAERGRESDRGVQELNNLKFALGKQKAEVQFLRSVLRQYVDLFDVGVHVVEKQRYGKTVKAARLAQDNALLPHEEVFRQQIAVLSASVDRLHEAVGGTRFRATALDGGGLMTDGTVAMLGHSALFRSNDGRVVGTVEQKLGILEPSVIEFSDAKTRSQGESVIQAGSGSFPFDPTMGQASKLAGMRETFLEHVEKGGVVMVPIFAMAGLALLVAIYKWLTIAWLGRPARKKVAELLDLVARDEKAKAEASVRGMKGPLGEMLVGGVEHMREPRELVEEVMYETVLKTRLSLQKALPFIAICAAAAPLLGLLGTVTGIIETFRSIMANGASDVKSLSGGISAALITTEFGLIVAIPSLLLHAYLSRRVRAVVGQMETTAVSLLNRLPIRTGHRSTPVVERAQVVSGGAADPGLIRAQVEDILSEILRPLAGGNGNGKGEQPKAV